MAQEIQINPAPVALDQLTDHFDRELMRLEEVPSQAIDRIKASTIKHRTFLGQHQHWVIESYRVDGKTTTFICKSEMGKLVREVLPSDVVERIVSQHASLIEKGRRRRAKQQVDAGTNAFANMTKEQRLINLAKARKARRS
jgi:hypothetical protein